ncbi:MAG: methylmalonyl-CoA mutase family protein [Flavobacteriaceae bacterium]
MEHSFYSDFSPLSSSEQHQKMCADLKGGDFTTDLVWSSPEGFTVQPIYYPSSESSSAKMTAVPTPWQLTQRIDFTSDSALLLSRIRTALADAVEALYLIVGQHEALLEDIAPVIASAKVTTVLILEQFPSPEIVNSLKGVDELKFCFDFYGCFAQQGIWPPHFEQHTLLWSNEAIADSRFPLYVDTSIYANAGATLTQQLGFGLLHLNEYLHFCESHQIKKDQNVLIQFAQGGQYFLEIAKLKAFRLLANTLFKAYPFTINLELIAEPLQRNKTCSDYNVNFLRTSSEMMSAILGGANLVMNHPYDLRFNPPSSFADRMARNQLQLLKHESYFDRLPDVVSGTYYLEKMIEEFTAHAWALFLTHENEGGWLKQMHQNTIQETIAKSAQAEEDRIADGELVLVGTTKYHNPDALSAQPISEKSKSRTDLTIQPLLTTYLR